MEKYPASYEIFATPFKENNRRFGLKALDACLDAFYYYSPLVEPIPSTRQRVQPNLKILARMTVDAISFTSKSLQTKRLNEEMDILVAHVFCHWQVLVKALLDADHFEGYDQDQRMQDLIDICNILGNLFSIFIQDRHNHLGKMSKHAVSLFVMELILDSLFLV